MAGMDLGNEKQMSMNVATKVLLNFSDLVSVEKSVKKRTLFFSECKMGTRSSKFVFYELHYDDICLWHRFRIETKCRSRVCKSDDCSLTVNKFFNST